MFTILDFLVSPLGALFLLGIGFVLMRHVCTQTKSALQKLQTHFNATYSCLESGLQFTARGYNFHYTIQGSGAISYGFILKTPVLWTSVRSPADFLIANAEATKFQFDWNLRSKAYRKNISVEGVDLLIGSSDEQFLGLIERTLKENHDMAKKLSSYFQQKSSYLRASKEMHIGRSGSLVSHPIIMRYYAQTQVYVEPAVLEQTIEDICALFKQFGVTPN